MTTKEISSKQNLNKRIAVYPGSFDPITNGHIDLIDRGLQLFDEICVVVAINSLKTRTPLFSITERVAMIQEYYKNNPRIKVVALTDRLIVDYASDINASALLRGIRALSDFEFEFAMAAMNRALNDSIETVFLTPNNNYGYLSSSLIKEVAQVGGNVSQFVPKIVKTQLLKKLK